MAVQRESTGFSCNFDRRKQSQMKTKSILSPSLLPIQILILACTLLFVGCSKEEDPTSDQAYTVTVGVYILNGTTYQDQNKDFIFETQVACQSWSRTASGDTHNSAAHDHYNAAKNTTYKASTETITWTEYGPELDQTSIDATCENGSNGATKTANKVDYTADKNFFLKVKSVVEN